MASIAAFERQAHYKITLDTGYLRARLHNLETAEEMKIFLGTVARAGKVLECGRFLISLDTSTPMSALDRSVLYAYLSQLGASPANKVAVLGATLDSGAANDCIEPLAQGLNVQRFADEPAARLWVRNRRHGQERRCGEALLLEQDRRTRQLDDWAI